MNILLDSPVSFINAASPLAAQFVVFCAVWIPWLTIAWVLVYLLYRPIPNKDIFAPFENIRIRLDQLSLVCLSAVTALLLDAGLKNYFKIGRPVMLNFNLHPLLPISDYGFPSSHAAVFAAIAVSLLFIHKKAGIFAGLLALAIGIARVYAGVHTPLDILGGYLVGALVAILAGFFAGRASKKPAL